MPVRSLFMVYNKWIAVFLPATHYSFIIALSWRKDKSFCILLTSFENVLFLRFPWNNRDAATDTADDGDDADDDYNEWLFLYRMTQKLINARIGCQRITINQSLINRAICVTNEVN